MPFLSEIMENYRQYPVSVPIYGLHRHIHNELTHLFCFPISQKVRLASDSNKQYVQRRIPAHNQFAPQTGPWC